MVVRLGADTMRAESEGRGSVIADIFPCDQCSAQIGDHQFLWRLGGCADYDLHALFGKQSVRPLPHSPGDDRSNAFFGQPGRQESGLMRRSFDVFTRLTIFSEASTSMRAKCWQCPKCMASLPSANGIAILSHGICLSFVDSFEEVCAPRAGLPMPFGGSAPATAA